MTAVVSLSPAERREATLQEPAFGFLLREVERPRVRGARFVGLAQTPQQVGPCGVQQAIILQVSSPVNGFVTNLQVDAGDYATAGRALLAIVDSDSFYVAGYFEETKIRNLREGDKATVRLMGFSEDIDGHVDSISRAIADREMTQVSDSLIANINPTFSWVRLAQRVPVRIALDRVPDHVRLSAGMTATVVVHPSESR